MERKKRSLFFEKMFFQFNIIFKLFSESGLIGPTEQFDQPGRFRTKRLAYLADIVISSKLAGQIFNGWLICLQSGRQKKYFENTISVEQFVQNFTNRSFAWRHCASNPKQISPPNNHFVSQSRRFWEFKLHEIKLCSMWLIFLGAECDGRWEIELLPPKTVIPVTNPPPFTHFPSLALS